MGTRIRPSVLLRSKVTQPASRTRQSVEMHSQPTPPASATRPTVMNAPLWQHNRQLQHRLGVRAGHNLTTGDNNIDIGNDGVAAEANTIRIGTTEIKPTHISPGLVGLQSHRRTCSGRQRLGISAQLTSALYKALPVPGRSWPQGPAGQGFLQGQVLLVLQGRWCRRPRWSYGNTGPQG